jgi:hypothetical protein
MDLDFIGRTLKTFGILLLVYVPFGLYYGGGYPTVAVLSGGVWGMLNLLFLSAFIRVTLIPGKVPLERAIIFGLVKFPLLYLAGYGLLKISVFDPLLLLAGFSGVMAVMLLKAASRVLLGMDRGHENRGTAQRST